MMEYIVGAAKRSTLIEIHRKNFTQFELDPERWAVVIVIIGVMAPSTL
jgi:hypothetical protein